VIPLSKVDNYCRRLRELQIPKEALQEAQSIFQDVPELLSDLTNPSVALEHKTALIQRVFPTEVRDVLFVLCERGDLGLLPDIIAEYNLKYQEESGN
jgi:F0F1-type ATP synthase delta subunit